MKYALTALALLAATTAYAGDDDDKKRGPQGVQGPAGATGPQGAMGPAGPQGPAGAPAYINWSKVQAQTALTLAVGGLELPTPYPGGWSWSAGLGGSDEAALAAGIAYGFTDSFFAYGKVGFADGAEGYFIGVGGRF